MVPVFPRFCGGPGLPSSRAGTPRGGQWHSLTTTYFVYWIYAISVMGARGSRPEPDQVDRNVDAGKVMTTTSTTFAPKDFVPAAQSGRMQYASPRACRNNLVESADVLGVSKFQLGHLLGLVRPSTIYSWIGGQYRPGQVYSQRLVKLHIMNHTTPVALIRRIDWYAGLIHWKSGEVTEASSGVRRT